MILVEKKACLNLANESSGRRANQFYVNRFYVHRTVEIDENVTFDHRWWTSTVDLSGKSKDLQYKFLLSLRSITFLPFAFCNFGGGGWREFVHCWFLLPLLWPLPLMGWSRIFSKHLHFAGLLLYCMLPWLNFPEKGPHKSQTSASFSRWEKLKFGLE